MMTEPMSPPNTPIAVPWTPDMMASTPTVARESFGQSLPKMQPPVHHPVPVAIHPQQHRHMPVQMPPMTRNGQQPLRSPVHAAQPSQMPPPMPLTTSATGEAEPAGSKSIVARILKRAPKQEAASGALTVAEPATSGSLLNRNFFIGAVTGLVIGAFILPMALDVFTADTGMGPQVDATSRREGPPSLAEGESRGESFVDAALASDAP